MRKIYFMILGSAALIFLGLGLQQDTPKPKFIGVRSCTCHNMASRGKQVDVWQKTMHANAYIALTSEEANKIAKEKGIEVPAAEAKECLCCHVTGYGEPEERFDEKYSKEEGVTCETCHGAASEWRPLHSKKDKLADAIEAGLVFTKLNENSKSIIEERCKSCHNEKSPTYKEFKLDEFWPKIAHPVPQK